MQYIEAIKINATTLTTNSTAEKNNNTHAQYKKNTSPVSNIHTPQQAHTHTHASSISANNTEVCQVFDKPKDKTVATIVT